MVLRRTISLNGQWEFSESGTGEWHEGRVPGCVQLDLLKKGDVRDPFYRMNEIDMHKLEGKDWIYRKDFLLTSDDMGSPVINLVFEGVDTFAEVYLNGHWLGRTENMFIPYTYAISDKVQEGPNRLELRFESPVRAIKEMERKSPTKYHSTVESARPFIRKAQYSYGWDWGPRITQVGLWRSVYIELSDDVKIVNPFCYTERLEEGLARLRISAQVEVIKDTPLEAEVIVSFGDVVETRVPVRLQERGGAYRIDSTIDITHPRLWYPNGMGEQPLYEIAIRVSSQGHLMDETRFRSGIRVVKLIQERDEEGRTFILEINGHRLFAKGANWVPADNLLPRLSKDDYYRYVKLAKDANMNMLRVWGGGIYEDTAFYEACDDMGIMVWQDFMYSCAQYPDDLEWFQKEAAREAECIVKSLRNHPAIVLWCGNNENNWGFVDWWGDGDPEYKGNYLYKKILPEICASNDPSRPYWISSPYGGSHPNSMDEGDRHSWDVWSNWGDYGRYLGDTGRFISEFGFQAMPTWKTVLWYTAPEDRQILSPVICSHNKMNEGMERLLKFLVGRLGLPKDLQSFVYLTQFNQAEAIKTGVEHWRMRKPATAGALYWQLNDCWPVASWSCIDFFGRKKGLWYYSRRFFAPVLPVIREEGDRLAFYAMSDFTEELDASVRIAAYSLAGNKKYETKFTTRLKADGLTTVTTMNPHELGIGYSPRLLPVDGFCTTLPREHNGELLDTVVYLELQIKGEVYRNYLVFDRFRNLNLQSVHIETQVNGDIITLRSDKPGFGVFVEPETDVDISDNCLILEPGVPYELRCSGNPGRLELHSVHDLILRA